MDELIKRLRESKNEQCYIECFGNCRYCEIDAELEQAADAIEELQSDNAALSGTVSNLIGQIAELSKPRWIPVSERLPDVPGTYLVLLKEPKKWAERRAKGEAEEWENFDFSHVEPAFYNKDQSIWDDDDIPMNANLDAVNTYEAFHVTHWMPLPPPPEEQI